MNKKTRSKEAPEEKDNVHLAMQCLTIKNMSFSRCKGGGEGIYFETPKQAGSLCRAFENFSLLCMFFFSRKIGVEFGWWARGHFDTVEENKAKIM